MQRIKDFLFANSTSIAVLAVVIAQAMGWISNDQAEKLRKQIPEKAATAQQQIMAPAAAPELTNEQLADMIRKMIEDSIKKLSPPPPTPAPAPQPTTDVTPPAPAVTPLPATDVKPVESVRIRLCDETGAEIAKTELEAGQLFRVSAVGVGESIGWHPVKSGDVKLSASTDGKEFAGYLISGQWIEFSLTDYASKSQASLRVTCLTAPQPPPVPAPGPGPAPPPQPGPDDSQPAGALGLIQASRHGLSLVPASSRSKAGVIAQAHLAAAELAKKDPFVVVDAMQKLVAEEIAKSLNDADRLAWKPWSDEVTRRVDKLQTDKKIVGADGWELAFEEIAEGLGGGR